jgi:PhoPQ-activated pathogenicity-related protein
MAMKSLLFFFSGLLLAAPPFDALFRPSEVLDRPSLDLKISAPSDYSPVSAPGRKLKRIDLTYTSFEWAGETWRHPCMVLLPERVAPKYAGDAVVIAGNGSSPDGLPIRYAEAAALMGIPALAIVGANPGPHYGAKNEGAVMARMEQKFLATGDPRWIGYAALGRVIVRAVTAMQAVPGVKAERFVVTGGSKRGMASWIAAAADDRIVGAYPGAWNMANFEAALRLRAERQGLDYGKGGEGPAAATPRQQLASLETPRGKEYQRFLDPFVWRDLVANKPILFTVGANDPLFPPLSDTVFLPDMPKTTRIMLIPNRGHGHDSERESAGWRMWMAHVFANRPVPDIALTSKREPGTLQLTAAVKSPNPIKTVTAWSASNERGNYLECHWAPTVLTAHDGVWLATLPAPASSYTAFFVEVEDEDARSGRGIISTGMQEIKP